MHLLNLLHWINFVSFFLITLIPYSKNAALSVYEQKKYKHLLEGQGLYQQDDDIDILTINNFQQSITNSNQAWLIEFYNSWCGYCQRFAPSWKALGTEIKPWNDMVRIGAIDCSVDENFPLCREYEIMGYPTLRYFHEHYQPGGSQKRFGVEVQKGEDVNGHRHYLIEQMINEQIDGRGRIYPNLLLYNHTDSLQLFDNVPANVQYAVLIIESPDSFIGKEIALDLHKIQNLVVRSAWNNNTQLIDHLKIDKFPTVIAIDRNNNREILENPGNTRETVKNAIKNYLKSKNINVLNEPIKNTEIFTGKWLDAEVPDMATLMEERARQALKERVKKMGNVVFQMDLETTLRYSLKHEIASIKTITGEKLQALRQYLDVLKKYFPFGHGGQMFLQELHELVTDADEVKGDDLARIVQKAEQDDSQVYSSQPQWLGCQGSTSNKRGYPCGLWKLFHYLTVNAAEQNRLKQSTNPHEILDVMYGYIKNYFGCADCSRHFQEMAQRRDMRNVSSFDSQILWLWMAHNEVNRRLSGDDTEDPEYPKLQFPSKQHCPQCRNPKDDTWNVDEVLRYLKHMYSNINIRYIGSDTRILHLGLEGGNNHVPIQTSGGSSIFKALDITRL